MHGSLQKYELYLYILLLLPIVGPSAGSGHRRSLVLAFGGAMASAVARAYNGGLGAVPPAGSRGRAPGQGVWGASPPRS